MAQPTQLTPTEQDALVKQIGLAMLRVAPEDWEQLTVDYRAVGRYAESTGQVVFSDGAVESWTMPPDLQGHFARLRGGMYREGRGTWYNARYKLDHPSSYNLEYDREEPVWDMQPPPQAYPDDMRLFPRSEDNVPEWLRRRLTTAPPPGPGGPGPSGPRFRVARIFDGPGEDGRPSVNRPHVAEEDIADLLDYLDGAPIAGPARGYDVDRLDPEGRQSVPVAFHTDGVWIWPAAVNYYLREHDISPENDLVEHIQRMRFQLPNVDDATRSAAGLFLGPPPPGPGGPGPGGPGGPPRPPVPAPTRAMPVPPPPGPGPGGPPPRPAGGPPPAALPSQGPPGRTVEQLRSRLADLGVPESAFRIGPPAGRAWTMEQTDEGWRVGFYDRAFVAPAMFEDVADASAFLIGKLLLDGGRESAARQNGVAPTEPNPLPTPPPAAPPPPAESSFEPPFEPPFEPSFDDPPFGAPFANAFEESHTDPDDGYDDYEPPAPPRQPVPQRAPVSLPATMVTQPAERHPDSPGLVATALQGLPNAAATPGAEWPIAPLPGEPPLTLFRGKRVIELEPGTEIDRFGDDDGNLVYAVGTPFQERSLVPEWVERPYHVYRVRQPVQALTGAAIPWFEQPGGGTAYLLPDAVGDLVAHGHLVEVPGRDRPS